MLSSLLNKVNCCVTTSSSTNHNTNSKNNEEKKENNIYKTIKRKQEHKNRRNNRSNRTTRRYILEPRKLWKTLFQNGLMEIIKRVEDIYWKSIWNNEDININDMSSINWKLMKPLNCEDISILSIVNIKEQQTLYTIVYELSSDNNSRTYAPDIYLYLAMCLRKYANEVILDLLKQVYLAIEHRNYAKKKSTTKSSNDINDDDKPINNDNVEDDGWMFLYILVRRCEMYEIILLIIKRIFHYLDIYFEKMNPQMPSIEELGWQILITEVFTSIAWYTMELINKFISKIRKSLYDSNRKHSIHCTKVVNNGDEICNEVEIIVVRKVIEYLSKNTNISLNNNQYKDNNDINSNLFKTKTLLRKPYTSTMCRDIVLTECERYYATFVDVWQGSLSQLLILIATVGNKEEYLMKLLLSADTHMIKQAHKVYLKYVVSKQISKWFFGRRRAEWLNLMTIIASQATNSDRLLWLELLQKLFGQDSIGLRRLMEIMYQAVITGCKTILESLTPNEKSLDIIPRSSSFSMQQALKLSDELLKLPNYNQFKKNKISMRVDIRLPNIPGGRREKTRVYVDIDKFEALYYVYQVYEPILKLSSTGTSSLKQDRLVRAFAVAIDSALANILNINDDDELAHYCEYVLNPIRCKNNFDSKQYDCIAKLFKYCLNKERFKSVYQDHLMSRLLNHSYRSLDDERFLVSKLKDHYNIREVAPEFDTIVTQFLENRNAKMNDISQARSFTSDLNAMIDDIEKSNSIYQRQLLDERMPTNIKFHANVITRGFWPINNIVKIKLPTLLKSYLEAFEDIYRTSRKIKENDNDMITPAAVQAENHRLVFVHTLGFLYIDFIHPTLTNHCLHLRVSFLQGMILLLFNHQELVRKTTQEIIEELDTTPSLILSALHSLSFGKYSILNKIPSKGRINLLDNFEVNLQLFATVSNHSEIQLPAYHPQPSKRRLTSPKLDKSKEESIEKPSNRVIEALIDSRLIRLLKRNKLAKGGESKLLIQRICEEFSKWKIDEEFVKKRVDHLEHLDFIEETQPGFYKYVP